MGEVINQGERTTCKSNCFNLTGASVLIHWRIAGCVAGRLMSPDRGWKARQDLSRRSLVSDCHDMCSSECCRSRYGWQRLSNWQGFIYFSLPFSQSLLGQKFLITCSHSCLQFSAFIVLPSQPHVAEKLFQSLIQTVERHLFPYRASPASFYDFFFQPYSNRTAQDVSSISFPPSPTE